MSETVPPQRIEVILTKNMASHPEAEHSCVLPRSDAARIRDSVLELSQAPDPADRLAISTAPDTRMLQLSAQLAVIELREIIRRLSQLPHSQRLQHF